MSSCSQCGAEIRWVKTTRGKNLPLDPAPVSSPERGNFVLEDGIARYVSDEERRSLVVFSDDAFGADIWEAHFATCTAKRR